MKPLLIACDFDGTITQRDTLHVIVEEFGERALWDEIEPQLRSGVISVEQALQAEFDTVRADLAQVLATVAAAAPVRPGFGAFVAWAQAQGHTLLVCSNGFRCVIDAVLARAGAGHLPVVANDARFSRAGTTIVWDDRGDRCELCDRPCKRGPLTARRDGRPVVLIGDGISDRCAAGMADVVFARDGLARDLAAAGRDFTPFDDFHEVRTALTAAVAA